MLVVLILKSTRPQQWIKNLFIFAPLIFSQNATNLPLLLRSLAAFALFSLLSGALYIYNDLHDIEEDKHHPDKSKRPIASGRLSKTHGYIAFLVLASAALLLSFFFSIPFFIAAHIYFLMQLAYTRWLKHLVILDVLIIAAGFLLRVIAGGLAISVDMSNWLLLCTLLLALFLAMAKRRHEISLLHASAAIHRPILKEYSQVLLDQMIAVVTASTLIAYCLYTISDETIAKFGTSNLIYTVPFVIYGIFRYLYLIHQKAEGGSPESLILKDKPLLADLILWITGAALILYVL